MHVCRVSLLDVEKPTMCPPLSHAQSKLKKIGRAISHLEFDVTFKAFKSLSNE